MIAALASITRNDDGGVVRRPMPGDAIGAALRSLYDQPRGLPDDMEQLLRRLDRPGRGH